MWRSGSAQPCQGWGREFESRHPLSEAFSPCTGGVAERRGSGLQSRVHGFESRLHLQLQSWAIGAVVARFPDTEEVAGSNPVSPTKRLEGLRGDFLDSSTSRLPKTTGLDANFLQGC